jgi:hypothetical protein
VRKSSIVTLIWFAGFFTAHVIAGDLADVLAINADLERQEAAEKSQVADYNPEAAVAAGIKPSKPLLRNPTNPANIRHNLWLLERYDNALAAYNAQQYEKGAREEAINVEREIQRKNEEKRKAVFFKAVEESKAETIRLYPDAAVTTSALARRTSEIADHLEAEKNPIVYAADAPLVVTQMAAKELGIAAMK